MGSLTAKWFFCIALLLARSADAQSITKTEHGFNKLSTARVSIITDLEFDAELKSWPDYLDQAIEQWKSVFAPAPIKLQGLQTTVYLIGDRSKWQKLGLLDQLPNLIDGYQAGDDLYVVDQPSKYYRRLLFLHEATHWIMYRWQGGAGAPWLMEGMADYLGTHQLQGSSLRLGFMPDNPEQVPYWGRLRLIRDTLNKNTAPKLSAIVAFQDMQQQRMERYSWSWAACTFFSNHPELREDFQSLYRGQLDYSLVSSVQWLRSMEKDWKRVSIQWRCFVDELDFGLDMSHSAMNWATIENQPLPVEGEVLRELKAERGWQSTGIVVEPGATVDVKVSGRIVVQTQDDGSRWVSEPQGITVEYYRGNPLGCVLGVLAAVDEEQPTSRWDTMRVGKRAQFKADKRSVLLLKINEPSRKLADNQGTLQVSIHKVP